MSERKRARERRKAQMKLHTLDAGAYPSRKVTLVNNL